MHNATSKRAVSLAPASGRAVSLVHLCNKFMARTDKVHSPNAATKQEATAALIKHWQRTAQYAANAQIGRGKALQKRCKSVATAHQNFLDLPPHVAISVQIAEHTAKHTAKHTARHTARNVRGPGATIAVQEIAYAAC